MPLWRVEAMRQAVSVTWDLEGLLLWAQACVRLHWVRVQGMPQALPSQDWEAWGLLPALH